MVRYLSSLLVMWTYTEYHDIISVVDLGLDTWNAHSLGDLEVIPLHRFSGQFALAELRERIWVTISLETACIHTSLVVTSSLII